MKKILLRTLIIIIVLFTSYKIWNKYINYNFGTITENKVYKSGAIEPSLIHEYIKEHNIKTVIDLRDSQANASKMEKDAVLKTGTAQYFNIKSPQVPTEDNLKDFFEIMDNKDNYPVLIHCYHGLGRTMLYTALYRIEYENMSNENAKSLTRPYAPEEFLFYKSSFADENEKGNFLKNYIPRKSAEK